MFKKILLPLDLTDRHVPALQLAARLAKQGGGEVTLLHVIELIHGLTREEEPTFYGRLERKAAAHLERWAEALAAEQVSVQAEVVFGKRVREVVGYASRAEAEVIVLTSPRLAPERLVAGFGSLSFRISMLSGCPVLFAR